ncbi:MAG: Rrf2 family transcriptional regulator [Planctomycetia bacterium]|nr:MAG: Rrf2 family transcriptional regulator [Planctomycetia bacterium]
MLSLTKKAEYALIAMYHLARGEAEAVWSARDISIRHGVPLPLLMNVLKTLHHAGLVRSTRGARGGYTLDRPSGSISLAEIIEAVEGPVALVECVGEAAEQGGCDLTETCPIRAPIARIHARLRQVLADVSLADVAYDEGLVELNTPRKTSKVLAR